jgi:hypothetical protein
MKYYFYYMDLKDGRLAMGKTTSADTVTISKRQLRTMLREVVREVVHDELTKLASGEGWEIEEGSPIWRDLVELREEARKGQIELLTHEQVFGK